MEHSELVSIRWQEEEVQLEIARLGWDRKEAPLVVFLHEGLGSVAMWRDFPARLCDRGALRGLVFSRPGYGRSTPRKPADVWKTDFMHRQAYEVLPALLAALGIDEAIWLFGHSDGGSIALIYGARFVGEVAGLIVLAPHLFVEEKSLAAIEKTRQAFLAGDLAPRLERYHDDVGSAFWGWNDIWLDPAFKSWNIEGELAAIQCPVLAIQGIDDEYGTLAQIREIARRVPGTTLLELAHCGHSPHRDQAEQTIEAALALIKKNR